MRTGQYTSENLKRFIGELYPSCDFFLHTWSINDYKTWHPGSPKVEELCELHNITDRTINNPEFLTLISPWARTPSFSAVENFNEKYPGKLISVEIEDEKSYHDNFKLRQNF